ncbi:MAG: hypothetical protein JWQ25_845 [Daejeonella sp.]|nr:hypothetical protein [Daejeonella sp.]
MSKKVIVITLLLVVVILLVHCEKNDDLKWCLVGGCVDSF